MGRFNPTNLPTAATFFGRQTSGDDITPTSIENGSAPSRKHSSNSGGHQAMEKSSPSRGLGFRNLAPSLSWNKRFGGIQRSNSNSFFGPKVDNENKDIQPRLRNTRSDSQSSNLKPPPPYATQSFQAPTAIAPQATYPSKYMYVPEAATTQPSRHPAAPLSPKQPSPGSMARVPPTRPTSSGRYGSRVATLNQGYSPEGRRPQMQKQNSFRRDLSVVEHRPQKPHRQDSRSVMHHPQQQHHSHPSRERGCPYQQHGSFGLPTEQHSQRFYPFVQGNGQLSPIRAWNDHHISSSTSSSSTLQDDLYRKESYKNFDYSNAKKLKPPPPSSLPGGSSPASSSSPNSKDPTYMEIYPGVNEVLRGSEETTLAIERGFVVSCQCMVCTSSYQCIADAAYVICPECRTISRVESNNSHVHGIHMSKPYGLGLGFVPECHGSPAAAGFS